MNIHIESSKLAEALIKASIVSTEFGSTMYKTNDGLSDTDMHHIYATTDNELNSFLKSHHHLQYKIPQLRILDKVIDIDHIFVSLHTFLSNTIKGDSTVLFEIIHSKAFVNTPLSFIHDMRNDFINYAIVRSYLGFARRDIQHYHKSKTHREQIKSLSHIHRGYFFAKSLLEGNFSLVNDDFLKVFAELKSIGETEYTVKKQYLAQGNNLVSDLREKLNLMFNNNSLTLPKYMSIEAQEYLDNKVNGLMKMSGAWFMKQQQLSKYNLMPIFYEAFEKDINY